MLLGRAAPLPWVAPRLARSMASHGYSLAQHQWRAERQAGRVPNKFAFTRGKPRVDKKFAECVKRAMRTPTWLLPLALSSRLPLACVCSGRCERAWILVDGYGATMGRLASTIAQLLCGKHKPIFAHKRDVGDHVVVVNAAFVVAPQNALDVRRKSIAEPQTRTPPGRRLLTCAPLSSFVCGR